VITSPTIASSAAASPPTAAFAVIPPAIASPAVPSPAVPSPAVPSPAVPSSAARWAALVAVAHGIALPPGAVARRIAVVIHDELGRARRKRGNGHRAVVGQRRRVAAQPRPGDHERQHDEARGRPRDVAPSHPCPPRVAHACP
jgi:hypothetical protein